MSTAESPSTAPEWSFSFSAGLSPEKTSATGGKTSATTSPAAPVARKSAGNDAASLEFEVQATAAILELVRKLVEAHSASQACQTLAVETAQHLGCQRVAVALVNSKGDARLAAVSDSTVIDHRSEMAACLEAALDETIAAGRLLVWPPADGSILPLQSLERLAKEAGAGGVISGSLTLSDGTPVGAWALLGTHDFAHNVAHQRLVEAASEPVAAVLKLQTGSGRLLPARWRSWLSARAWLRPRVVIAGLACVAAVLCIPMRDRVSCQCELQPTLRRFVAAPFEGVFEKSLVRPGDRVKPGQTLGRMDGREIRLELSAVQAEQQRAGKSRDVNMAAGKVAAAQIDQLEMKRLELKQQLLARRQQQLSVESPIDGIVLSGDLERSAGAQVKLGQTLFEIGPLESMVAEVAIADEDIARVSQDSSVTISFEAYPGAPSTAQISRIHPRSEVRQTENVFIAEVVLPNGDHALRPGMKGEAVIIGHRQTLFWTLVGRPWQRLCTWIGL